MEKVTHSSDAAVKALMDSVAATIAKRREEHEPSSIRPGKEGSGWRYRVEQPQGTSTPGAGVGLRVAVKETITVRGIPTSFGGDQDLEIDGPLVDADAVQMFRDQGFAIVGTTISEELAFSGSSFTSKPQPLGNPWQPARSAGGSSSGAGVVVARGEADISIGSDHGGSVRHPAAWCGLTGYKPTFGTVSTTGSMPAGETLDHMGFITKHADLMLHNVFSTIARHEPRFIRSAGTPSRLRLAILTDALNMPRNDPQVSALVRDASEKFAEVLDQPLHQQTIEGFEHAPTAHRVISLTESRTCVFERGMVVLDGYGVDTFDVAKRWVPLLETASQAGSESVLGPAVRNAARNGAALHDDVGAIAYAAAKSFKALLTERLDAAFESADLLLAPTTPMAAHVLPIGDLERPEVLNKAFEMHDINCIFNVSGHPTVTVPCGFVDGVPVGLLMVARKYEDELLIKAAHLFQQKIFKISLWPTKTESE